MICLGFNSMGLVNNPACWSFILHQVEGQWTYTLSFYEHQKAVIPLLKANTTRDCLFTTYLKELLARPNVQIYIWCLYRDGKLDTKRHSVTSSPDRPHLHTNCLEWIQVLYPVISQDQHRN
jgi:hypothetical protein